MSRNIAILVASTLLCGLVQAQTSRPATDIYGGSTAIKGQATGYFHMEKIGPQWVFVTPEGNGLYPLTVAAIYFNHPGLNESGKDYTQVIDAKYRKEGDADKIPARERWADKVRDRLRQWGFTAIGPYSYEPVTPNYSAKNQYYLGNKIKGLSDNPMSYIATQNNMERPMVQAVVHNVWSPLMGNSSVGTAMWADVFDPKFAKAVEQMAKDNPMTAQQKKWVLFAFVEQGDYMRGIAANHPHLGWAAAATNFEQKEGVSEPFKGTKSSYEDPKIYTKYALRDYLKGKYEKIEKLNDAWGTKYSSWDSDGGWGKGAGFLDEDGRNIGPLKDFEKKARPAVLADLDVFAAKMVRQFFKTVYEIRKKECPEVLMSTNNFGAVRPYFIDGLVSEDGKVTYADVIACSNTKMAPQWYDKLKKPFFVISITAMAPNDSPLGYRGKIKSLEYDDALKNKKDDSGKPVVDRTSDPKKNADKDVDEFNSRVIIHAEGVDFWWAGSKMLKIPYRTFTQFSSTADYRGAGGETNVLWPSRPWKSQDWLSKDTFAVHQVVPFGYFHLKKTLKPGDEFWRAQRENAVETQEQRAKMYRDKAMEVVATKAANGDYVFVGFNYWAWWDTSWTGILWDEAFNCGMVTFNDNAYDGKEAVFDKGVDKDGYPIGGEKRPPHISADKKGFGDFVTGVTATNKEIIDVVNKRAKKE